jgi:UDP-glucose:glycoprotein glucosyltransferase
MTVTCVHSIDVQLVGPIKPGTFEMEDFDLFEMYELRKRTKPVIDLLKTMYHDITAFNR